MTDLAIALGVVFIAELGDKTQLVALSLGARYRPINVVAALGATILVLQTLSVTIGSLIGDALSPRLTALIAGTMFIGFGVWTWWASHSGDTEDDLVAGPPTRGLAAVAIAFFIAELGDKTMLTTAALAADRSTIAVWIGSTLAMLTATTVAVIAGRALTRHVSQRGLQLVGAIAFLAVGTATLAGALL
jgi:putative Ca2+/H+ antiporter (TMEM165/GDT1 family)